MLFIYSRKNGMSFIRFDRVKVSFNNTVVTSLSILTYIGHWLSFFLVEKLVYFLPK